MKKESFARALRDTKAAWRAERALGKLLGSPRRADERAMADANYLVVATGWHGVPERVLNRIRTDEYLGLPVSDEDKRLARAIVELQVAKEYFFKVWRDYYATQPSARRDDE